MPLTVEALREKVPVPPLQAVNGYEWTLSGTSGLSAGATR